MINLAALKTVRVLVDQNGQPSDVQISIEEWEALLAWIEDLEDRALVKSMANKLDQGPEASGALRWEDVRDEWLMDEANADQ